MSILDHFASLTTYQKLFLLEVFIFILLAVVITIYFRLRDKAETQRDKPLHDARVDDETRSTRHRYTAPITGKTLFLQMNEAYFDAIFSAFLRSLQRAGYTLSDRETGVAPLLSGSTIDAMAREVERARQEFLTVLGSNIEDDICFQMQSGRAPKFLIQLIDSCERLGWKVMPVVREPEEECASSFSALP
ncbi:hypothetical protein [Rahnella aceris]|uniref:hypothetical protein n=1 Tax=Rahnella sp. (strain Y9602) TaxID=2703885 RepID=UPI003668147A